MDIDRGQRISAENPLPALKDFAVFSVQVQNHRFIYGITIKVMPELAENSPFFIADKLIEPASNSIISASETTRVEPKAMRVLTLLASHTGPGNTGISGAKHMFKMTLGLHRFKN